MIIRRVTRAVAVLAIAATPVLGAIAAGHSDGFMAKNGFTHGYGVGGSESVRVLADDGVINSRG